jgi:hypothetical protein
LPPSIFKGVLLSGPIFQNTGYVLFFDSAARQWQTNGMNFTAAAAELRQQEIARLSAATVPTLESLRFLNPRQLRASVAGMLQRLDYELLTPETAADLLAIKDGQKYVIAFAPTLDPLPTQANHLTRLHSIVIGNNAVAGFFITTRGFSRDAEAYAATAPLKLVDGPKLVASIKRSMAAVPKPDSYKAMCHQCGEIVTHRLGCTEAVQCRNGHSVAPTIASAALAVRTQEGGSTSRTYQPPRRYTRREVNAHNAKYIARMKRKRTPKEPAPDYDAAPDPFAATN